MRHACQSFGFRYNIIIAISLNTFCPQLGSAILDIYRSVECRILLQSVCRFVMPPETPWNLALRKLLHNPFSIHSYARGCYLVSSRNNYIDNLKRISCYQQHNITRHLGSKVYFLQWEYSKGNNISILPPIKNNPFDFQGKRS